MTDEDALSCLAALGHPTRLQTFRRLVEIGREGLSTGELVEATGLSQSTFSTHLAVLVASGLVTPEKRGRQMIQHVDITRLQALMLFLVKDCCGGRSDLCEPLIAQLSCS